MSDGALPCSLIPAIFCANLCDMSDKSQLEKDDIFDKKTAINKGWLDGRNIYVFSDLHSGDGTARDNFKYYGNEAKLKSCFARIKEEDNDSVILILGDYLEFWQSPFGAVLKNNLSLMNEFVEREVVYILGNHDNELLDFLDPKISSMLSHKLFSRMGEAVLIDRGGKRIALAHGHEVDPFNSSAVPGKGRVVAIIAGMFEDEVGSPFLPNGKSVEKVLLGTGERLMSLGIRIYMKMATKISLPKQMKGGSGLTPSNDKNTAERNVKSWKDVREKKVFDILVCGHTHKPGVVKDSKDIPWYYNSGSWADGRNTYLKIDLDGVITIHEWKDDNVIPVDDVLSY